MDHHSQPLVSVVIPTNGSSTLADCVASAQKALAGTPSEVLVIHDQGGGVSETRNRGLNQARGQYFILIDDDCFLESADLIQKILACAGSPSIHGGVYRLQHPASYWARVYSLVNDLWLERGKSPEGFHRHLLGGFIFGSRLIKNQIQFSVDLKWGGEEKELLLRLEPHGIYGKLHSDLQVCHHDHSGFQKFLKRAFLQGLAAGEYGLQSIAPYRSSVRLPWLLLPGLLLFYLFSRSGIFLGKVKSIFGIKVKTAESSPIP